MPAWKTCHNGTAVKHLDVDAPRVLRGLFEQQVNDGWQHRSVQCSAGDYISDDYCAPAPNPICGRLDLGLGLTFLHLNLPYA